MRNPLRWLFPDRFTCVCCGREVFNGKRICDRCAEALTKNEFHACVRCGMPFPGEGLYCGRCAPLTVCFERAYSVYVYDEAFKPLLYRFKERGERYLADFFAEEMASYLKSYAIEADLLTYVPASVRRRRMRGFDQSELLCRALSRASGIPARQLLERVQDRPEQKELSGKERRENLKGAFRLVRPRQTVTERVLLIDDVVTTLATVNECCRILSRVCENGVKVFTICTAVRKTDSE